MAAITEIKSTEKAENLMINLNSFISVAQMENHLKAVIVELDLYISHITTLGRNKYPGNRHWHFKQKQKGVGCLDITYWPTGKLMWITMRKREPKWVFEAGYKIKHLLEQYLDSKSA